MDLRISSLPFAQISFWQLDHDILIVQILSNQQNVLEMIRIEIISVYYNALLRRSAEFGVLPRSSILMCNLSTGNLGVLCLLNLYLICEGQRSACR